MKFDSLEIKLQNLSKWDYNELIESGLTHSNATNTVIERVYAMEYPDFQYNEPIFLSSFDRQLFHKSKSKNYLGFQPPEKLVGKIWILVNGYTHKKTNCGWKSNIHDFSKNKVSKISGLQKDTIYVPMFVPEGYTFQHFMDGVLPKLMQIQAVLNWTNIKLLFRNAIWSNAPIILDILKALGVTKDRIVVRVETVVPIMFNTCVTPPVHPFLWQKVRRILGGAETLPVSYETASVILLTRAGSRNGGRKMLNQKELEAHLRKRYRSKLVIFKGGYGLEAARSMFSSASIVIGVHGGAFYNIYFCPRKTSIIEIIPIKQDGVSMPTRTPAFDIFWRTADMLGMDYYRIFQKQSIDNGDLVFDLHKLTAVLDMIHNRTSVT